MTIRNALWFGHWSSDSRKGIVGPLQTVGYRAGFLVPLDRGRDTNRGAC